MIADLGGSTIFSTHKAETVDVDDNVEIIERGDGEATVVVSFSLEYPRPTRRSRNTSGRIGLRSISMNT
jgi:hypothetical protein